MPKRRLSWLIHPMAPYRRGQWPADWVLALSRFRHPGCLLLVQGVKSRDSVGADQPTPGNTSAVVRTARPTLRVARSVLPNRHECDRLQSEREKRRLHQSGRRSFEPLRRVALRPPRWLDRQLPASLRQRIGLPVGLRVSPIHPASLLLPPAWKLRSASARYQLAPVPRCHARPRTPSHTR